MIRRPQELTEPIREAVNHRAVLLSHIILAVTVAAHTALDPTSSMFQIILAIGLSITLIILILLRVFDMGSVNNRPLVYLVFYQIFCFLGITFISDPATPYIIGLYLVVFISNLYYGAKGVWVTVACFAVTTIAKYIFQVQVYHIGLNPKLNIVVAFILFAGVCSLYVNYQKVFDWDRAKLKETEAKLISSINSLQLGFVITNTVPEITMLNNTSHALLCGSKDHNAASCHNVTLAGMASQLGAGAELRGVVADSLRTRHPGSIKSLELNDHTWRIFVTPMVDGDAVSGAAIVLQDISEEQVLNRSRDEFFSIASHELHTPLTAIRGNASIMLEYYPEAFKDPELKQMLHDMSDSSERLIGIVNDFLDVSRLEQGPISYQLESVSIATIAKQVVNEMRVDFKAKKIAIELRGGFESDHKLPLALGDKDRITQIIYNLVGNALKFTEAGSVSIDIARTKHDMLQVTITDTGLGIATKLQPLLFHKFQQAGESLLIRDSSRGTGLGLYISRLLVEGMAGELVLERSAPGQGSTFTFTIPIATPTRLKHIIQEPTLTTDSRSGLHVPTK